MGYRSVTTLGFISLLIILCAQVILTSTHSFKGDGYEYMLMTESLSQHFSPEARTSDVEDIAKNIQARGYRSPIDEPIFTDYLKMLQGGKESMGYFKDKNKSYYSYHFWFYSLINLPAFYLSQWLGFAPVRTFLITNLGIFILTLMFLWHTALLTSRERVLMIAFYIFSGTTYYLDWSHPEVLSASLLLVGLLYILKNKLLSASVLLALAAQQNPPIAFLDLLIIGWQGLCCLPRWRSLVPLVGVLLILFWSPLFFQWHFGTPSLIASIGAADSHFISAARLFSFFFDLNQGMIVAIPGVFLLCLMGILGLPDVAARKAWMQALLMLAFALILAIPVLTTGNWNSGQSIFLRYAYWGSMPVGVATMLLLNPFSTQTFKWFFILFLVIQIPLLLNYGISGREDTMRSKWLATYFLNDHPNWYNPLPAIFVKRNIDAPGAEKKFIYYYVNSRQTVTKILYAKELSHVRLSFCHQQSLMDLQKQMKPVATEEGWLYLNLKPTVCKVEAAQGLYKFESR